MNGQLIIGARSGVLRTGMGQWLMIALTVMGCSKSSSSSSSSSSQPPPAPASSGSATGMLTDAAATAGPDAAPGGAVATGDPTADGGFPSCPEGTVQKKAMESPTAARWCEKPGGVKHGPETVLYANGKRESYRTYADNVEVGVEMFWDEQGRVTTRRLYAHGHPAGVELKYENGVKVKEVTWTDDGDIEKAVNFDANGKANTSNEVTCPPGTTRHLETNVDMGPDCNCMATGRRRVTCVRDGKPDGPYVVQFPGGELEVKGTYRAGKRTGLETHYTDEGVMSSEGSRTNDLRSGTWTEYYLGKKHREVVYGPLGAPSEERHLDDDGKVTGGVIFNKTGAYVDEWTGPKRPHK